MSAVDLDAYFERIGYRGPRAPTLATLRAIHLLHPQAIPFENLSPLLGEPVRLDAASLEHKLVRGRRGGYCFEHNLLLKTVLEALGFRVTGLAARVLWGAQPGAITPRDHMLLRLDLDEGSYIADVGFGGETPTAPLRLAPGIVQPTPHEPFRVRSAGSAFVVEAELRGVWQPLYGFDLHEEELVDYEVMSWYVSHHPDSHFVTGLSVARMGPGLRFTLRDNSLAVHDSARGTTERHALTTASALRAALEETFGIALPQHPGLEPLLARLAGDGATSGTPAPAGPAASARRRPVAAGTSPADDAAG